MISNANSAVLKQDFISQLIVRFLIKDVHERDQKQRLGLGSPIMGLPQCNAIED